MNEIITEMRKATGTVSTADHEHALAFNGDCRGVFSDISGLCVGIDGAGVSHAGEPEVADGGKPCTVAGCLNGAATLLREEVNWVGARAAPTRDDATDIDYQTQGLNRKSPDPHSGKDAAVDANGPFAHLFDGKIELNAIFHVVHRAATAA